MDLGDDNTPMKSLDETMDQIRAQLRMGGPPVDEERLISHLCGETTSEEKDAVAELVRTWKSWHDEYCKIRAYMSLAECNSSAAPEEQMEAPAVSESGLPPRASLTVETKQASSNGKARPFISNARRSILAVTILLVSVLVFFAFNNFSIQDDYSPLDIGVLASASRGSDPGLPITQDSDGVFRTSGRDFFLKIHSPIAGNALIAIRSSRGTRLYPWKGQSEVRLSANSDVEYGPLVTPDAPAVVAVVVSSDDLRDEVERYFSTKELTRSKAVHSALVRQFKALKLSHIAITVLDLEPVQKADQP